MKLDCLYPRNPMHAKRLPQLVLPVIITGVTVCDNVALDGIQVELRPPEEAPDDPIVDTLAEEEVRVLEPFLPVEPDPLLYVVERTHGSSTTILPFPHLSEDRYRPRPNTDEIPDSIERFSLDCWGQGTEFSFLSLGGRLGTLHAVLKVCGETNRSFTMLGPLDEDWSILHLDACGKPAYQGAIRPYL